MGELQPDETVDAVREARVLSKLDHPSIVKFHDSFIDGESFCIVTEYCEVSVQMIRCVKVSEVCRPVSLGDVFCSVTFRWANRGTLAFPFTWKNGYESQHKENIQMNKEHLYLFINNELSHNWYQHLKDFLRNESILKW